MDKKQAIEAIRNNWPDSRYSMLREALDIAIAAIEESMVQKPDNQQLQAKIAALIDEHSQYARVVGGNYSILVRKLRQLSAMQ